MKRSYMWIGVCLALILCVTIYIIVRNTESINQSAPLDQNWAEKGEDSKINGSPPAIENSKYDNEQIKSPNDPNQGEWDLQSN